MATNKKTTESKIKDDRIYIRIKSEIKADFELIAAYRGLKSSTLLHSMIINLIHEEKAKRPQIFANEEVPAKDKKRKKAVSKVKQKIQSNSLPPPAATKCYWLMKPLQLIMRTNKKASPHSRKTTLKNLLSDFSLENNQKDYTGKRRFRWMSSPNLTQVEWFYGCFHQSRCKFRVHSLQDRKLYCELCESSRRKRRPRIDK